MAGLRAAQNASPCSDLGSGGPGGRRAPRWSWAAGEAAWALGDPAGAVVASAWAVAPSAGAALEPVVLVLMGSSAGSGMAGFLARRVRGLGGVRRRWWPGMSTLL